MLKCSVLGSGSSGNCTLISSGDTHILIDLGLSTRRIVTSLTEMGIQPDTLSAILISHEHTDHVRGLGTFLNRFPTPVYMTEATAGAVTWNGKRPELAHFRISEEFVVGNLEVISFPIPHDAVEPSGFVVRCRGIQISQATDLGCITGAVKQRLRSSHCLIIESNHDENMLKIGPYPWPLKQRVLSRTGHLSNHDLGFFLEHDFDGMARHIILAHISLKNNHPELARLSAQDAISRRAEHKGESIQLQLAEQRCSTPLITID